MSSTTILNEILQKLSKVATEDELIQEPSVQEEGLTFAIIDKHKNTNNDTDDDQEEI